jgi:uncharacterized protein with FMN-binding domain
MRRAPAVLVATVAGTVALVSFHPRHAARAVAAGPAAGGQSYAGSVQETRYGPVQVRVTVRAGRLVDVTALQLPQNESRSTEISVFSAPLLRQEALQAQSAAIDTVSGATYTSDGYRASLNAALTSAKM